MLSVSARRQRSRAIQAFECWQQTRLSQNGNPLHCLTPPVSERMRAVTAIGTRFRPNLIAMAVLIPVFGALFVALGGLLARPPRRQVVA